MCELRVGLAQANTPAQSDTPRSFNHRPAPTRPKHCAAVMKAPATETRKGKTIESMIRSISPSGGGIHSARRGINSGNINSGNINSGNYRRN
jgi:hypothetical protein